MQVLAEAIGFCEQIKQRTLHSAVSASEGVYNGNSENTAILVACVELLY
jgi:hypothetical protein